MKIVVKAKTKAKVCEVKKLSQPNLDLAPKGQARAKVDLPIYQVAVKEAPVSGRANEAIIKALAEYFDISASRITLISGQTSKQKVFEIQT